MWMKIAVFPIVITTKNDKSVKIAVDMRKVNDSCKKSDLTC